MTDRKNFSKGFISMITNAPAGLGNEI